MIDRQLENDILNTLQKDSSLNFKEQGKYFQYGKCPECSRKTVYISKEKPGRLSCSHKDSCGYTETVRERYPHLFEDISERYPATPEDPNASANAYMSHVRGFPLVKISNWFSQGSLPLKNGKTAATVRFNLWDGYYWERLVNESDIRVWGDKNHNKKGLTYRGKGWQPPGQVIKKGDTIFVVEGIFHAIALALVGRKSIAAFSSNNLPREVISKNKTKGVTWALAYDNDSDPASNTNAGTDAARKFRKELHRLDQNVEIYLCPKGKDWDDLYKQGLLTDDLLLECLMRGRIQCAETLNEKIYWLYCKSKFEFRIIDFGSRFFSVRIESFAEELSKAIDEASTGEDEDHELFNATFEQALQTEAGKKQFHNAVKTTAISNCLPRFLFAQVDKITNEIAYHFAIYYPFQQKPILVSFSGSSLESPGTFKKALLNSAPGAKFDGEAYQLKLILDDWFSKRLVIVDSVPFVGYDKESKIFVYPNFAFYNGKHLKPNKSGFFSANNTQIKTSMRSISLQCNPDFDRSWFTHFLKVFDYNGLGVLGFFLGSLFAEQIRGKVGFFPFLEFTGEAGSGKTLLLEFCWKLFGRDNYEGFNPSKATFAARSRAFTQASNLPLVLIEGDSRDGSKDAKKGAFDFNEIKDLFNGRGVRATGVFNRGNDIDEPPFRGSVVIAQNETIDSTEAVITRIVHLHATRAHHDRKTKPLADWFRQVPIEDVSGFLYAALKKERLLLDKILHEYKKIEPDYYKEEKVKHGRIVECHSLVAAMVMALPLLIPELEVVTAQNFKSHLLDRAIYRQRRLNKDHPLVISFWDTYELINWQESTAKEAAFADLPGIETELLNHSMNESLIAINLPDYLAKCEKRGMPRLNEQDLRKLLPGSRRYEFVDNKGVKSKLRDGKSTWCYVFKKAGGTR